MTSRLPVSTLRKSRRKKAADFGFSPSELRTLRALKTPAGIQRYLDDMPYHLAGTAWSPRLVLREKTAHCLEGAIFAAAALRVLGFPPLILDLEADLDTDTSSRFSSRAAIGGRSPSRISPGAAIGNRFTALCANWL